MTGFGVSATYGLPDTGLVSAGEMVASAGVVCGALQRIPCIGDGDTGYGNAVNVKRTVKQYVQAGLAGIMLEDQLAPKRCGHTKGKSVVSREEACSRIKAAVDARNEGADIVILARTDARATLGLDEAIERLKLFKQLGADWTFLEAPQSVEEMRRYCQEVVRTCCDSFCATLPVFVLICLFRSLNHIIPYPRPHHPYLPPPSSYLAGGAETIQRSGRRSHAHPPPRRAEGHGIHGGGLPAHPPFRRCQGHEAVLAAAEGRKTDRFNGP